MNLQTKNPMAEYLLKIQMIVSNAEFKNKEEADKYETLESKLNGDKYLRAINKTDVFESYQYDDKVVYNMLSNKGYSDERIRFLLQNPYMLPNDIKNELLETARASFISTYQEPNKYYVMLTGKPFKGNNETKADEIVTIPEEFYKRYSSDVTLVRGGTIHEMPIKYQELFMNSEFYEPTLKAHPDARYLLYIGSNSIPISTSRATRDGDIMRINTNKLSKYHEKFGNVTVEPNIIHAFSNIYLKTRDYIYQTLRGDFSSIYPNYNSFIRFLTIYMSIGNALNEFQHKSSKLIYMNNITANNLFMLYGLPSVIMEGNPMTEFLKKFRLLLMDKGTNVVYRVKDLIGYKDTDIYTLVMVKQQVFEDGIPVYYYDENGNKYPKQNIVFRRLGTTDDNTSYFKFRESKKEYTVDEITSGDPRWWNTPEVEAMLQDMNYTLSNSKYIQLSTHMSMSDIWWQCVIFIRGILDRRLETFTTLISINRNINGNSTMSVFEAVLALVVMMHWQLTDAFNNNINGDMYIPSDGRQVCVDMLFNGLKYDGSPNQLKPGLPFKVSAFNFDIRDTDNDAYMAMYEYDYLDPDYFMPMLNKVLDMENTNIGEVMMKDVKLIYKYLENKLVMSRTIQQFRQVTDTFKALFLVDPIRKWHETTNTDTDALLAEKYDISENEIESLNTFFNEEGTYTAMGEMVQPDIIIEYNNEKYSIFFNTILNNNAYDIKINDTYPFRDYEFLQLFNLNVYTYDHDKDLVVQQSTLPTVIKENYKQMIIDKVNIDLGNSIYGPTTFENLLMIENPSLYEYLLDTRKNNSEDLILLIRSIIKALESYANTSLTALECKALGIEEYFRILREVISYFKSYMVEFTKEEFTYVLDGLFDNGGNSNMLRLYDEIASYDMIDTTTDSMSLFDASYTDTDNVIDDNIDMYDDVIIRIESNYKDLLDLGYDVYYDDGKRITKNPPFEIKNDTDIVANIVHSQTAYKIIININNLDVIPPNYYGNTR